MNKMIVSGKTNAVVNGLSTEFWIIEKPGFVAGGGVALVHKEADAHQFVEQSETIATLREQNAELIAALEKLVNIMQDTNQSGTNVDGRWMGVPEWEDVEDAAAILAKVKGGDNA